MKILSGIAKFLVKTFIRIYQKLFSFDHSFWARPEKFRVCIYYPSCSDFTIQAVDRFGVIRGLAMGTSRILRCNGFNKSGYDPVPDKFTLKANRQDPFA